MLALIRYILIAIGFLIINAIVFVGCIVRPFHRDNVNFAGLIYSQMSRVLGVKLDIKIDEKIKKDESYVYIANHQNSYDLFTVCRAAQPGVVTIGKKSLKWIPLFGQIYFLSGNIMIDRNNSEKAKGSLSLAAKKIRERNLSVWFFPEGTRSYGRGLLPFKSGAFRLALDTQKSIVMVCVSNTHKKIDLNRWNNGTIHIKLCAPEAVDKTKTAREWSNHFHQKMKHEIAQLDKQYSE